MKTVFPVKISCVIVAFFALTALLPAKTVSLGFQLGDVVAAEFTTAPVEIIGSETSPVVPPYRTKSYVAVVLKMQNRRTVNQLDYSLTISGVKAQCVAIASNMNSFVSEPSNEPCDGKNYIRMLYVFDGSRVRPGATAAGTLSLNYPTTADRKNSVTFQITNIGNKPFTDVAKIPASGLLK